MRKKISFILALVIFCVSVLSACSSNSSNVLFFAVRGTAGSFDPQTANDEISKIVVRNCFEGLLRYDNSGKPVNGVSSRYEISEDGLTYTFYLRDNALWHLTGNAKEQLKNKLPENFDLRVTANDFVFAMRRAVMPETNASCAYMLYNIKGAKDIMDGAQPLSALGVRALSDTVLEITLNSPQENFLSLLCEPVFMPCSETFFNATDGRYGTLIKFSLSNGPFYLSRFDETSYRINKSPDYAGESTAKPDAVWLYSIEDENKLIRDIEDNEYSGAYLSENEFQKLKLSDNFSVYETNNVLRSLILNQKDSILSNDNIRKAFSAATDISLVASNAEKTSTGSFVPVSASDQSVKMHPVNYNEKSAREYLEKGLKELEAESIDISISCEECYAGIIGLLIQEWQRILGVKVNVILKTASLSSLQSAVSSGNYQIVFYPVSAQTNSTFEFFGSLISSSEEIKNKVLPLLSSLYSGGGKVFSNAYKQLEEIFSAQSFYIPVWEENSYYVCTKGVKDVIFMTGRDKLYFHNAFSE